MPLERYQKILEGKELPKFKIAKEQGDLSEKAEEAKILLHSCNFCEHNCKADRHNQAGYCGVGAEMRVTSEFLHISEEPELVPSYTIFFAGCNMKCQYCQNHDISQNPRAGDAVTSWSLAYLIDSHPSAKNVNFVGGEPTPNLAGILAALKDVNINIPVVWNSNMYLSEKGMELLDGVVDIYLTDFKYGNDKCAKRLSKIDNYCSTIKRNHKLAEKSGELIIRHLLLPGHFECCTKPILDWIAANLNNPEINIMDQYKPDFEAHKYKEINNPIKPEDYDKAVQYAKSIGLTNLI
ncbi:radical SAM protein [Candidatus Undinarchaeota archaeon]